jgi:hypothetical protein
MRDNWLSNRIFKSYDDLVDHCCEAWNKLVDQPWRVMSIGLRQWARTGSDQWDLVLDTFVYQLPTGLASAFVNRSSATTTTRRPRSIPTQQSLSRRLKKSVRSR